MVYLQIVVVVSFNIVTCVHIFDNIFSIGLQKIPPALWAYKWQIYQRYKRTRFQIQWIGCDFWPGMQAEVVK